MHKIIAFDGGGIRGILTATLLERLAAAYPALLGNATLLAGTSSGGIIALSLATGMSPSAVRQLCVDSGPKIFDGNWGSLGGWFTSKYDNDGLRETLTAVFGGMTLGALAKEVLVSSFDLDYDDPQEAGEYSRRWKAKFFTNRPADKDRSELALDVALSTSAAPTYFPIYKGYIDGGVIANNPSVAALAQVLAPPVGQPNAYGNPGNVLLLSLGSGMSFKWIDETNASWGKLDWIQDGRIIEIMMEGVADVADFQCAQILAGRYKRLAPAFPPGETVDLDDVEKIRYLSRFAQEVEIAPAVQWLNAVGW